MSVAEKVGSSLVTENTPGPGIISETSQLRHSSMESSDMSSSQVDRRRRRRQKRLDEESIDSVSTVSRIVEDQDKLDNDTDQDVVSRRKKKLKKIKESSKDETTTDAENRPKKKKKKKHEESISSTEDFPASERRHKKKSRDRKKITGSQALLKEDFYSDPQLATTLQGKLRFNSDVSVFTHLLSGLEDDMYSVTGDADTSILSPYPLIPSIPSSQPVAKIYLEKNGGFSKTSVSAPVINSQLDPADGLNTTVQMTPLELGLVTQKVFRSLATFCHGFLAGLASWQVFTIYILHDDDLQFVDLYSPLSQPLMIAFYLLTIVCTVSVCDR